MRTRAQQLRARVLDAIADDYEEIGQIVTDLGQEYSRDDVTEALAELVARGWAQAYVLSGCDPNATPMESPDRAWYNDLYFLITPAGRDALKQFPEAWFGS